MRRRPAGPGLAGLFADAPEEAVGAIRLMDEGPVGLGQPWDGYDMLLVANLTDETLVMFGAWGALFGPRKQGLMQTRARRN